MTMTKEKAVQQGWAFPREQDGDVLAERRVSGVNVLMHDHSLERVLAKIASWNSHRAAHGVSVNPEPTLRAVALDVTQHPREQQRHVHLDDDSPEAA